MPVQAKRFALLMIALGIIAVSLVACQTPSSASSGGSNTILIPTPNTSNLTPTPKFPGFTVGAWPSNFSPNLNDTVTIYVVCRIQDQSMQGPSHPPPAGVQVNVGVGSPINQNFTARTGADGYATVTFNFNDPNPGQPVVVNVTTNYPGSPPAQTFFTPGVNTAPTPTTAPDTGTPTVSAGP
jgi:hypothetical protein